MIENFTPYTGLAGGAVIGLAAAALLLLNGNVLGASGILSSITCAPSTTLQDASQQWKFSFLASFLVVTTLFLTPYYNTDAVTEARPLNKFAYGLAGLLVGSGTRLSNGCTSGHGICGLARFSKRSFAAVMVFMATGMLTAIGTSPTAEWHDWTEFLRKESESQQLLPLGSAITMAVVVLAVVASAWPNEQGQYALAVAKRAPAILSGALFAIGLLVSDMVYPSKVFQFLTINGIWNENEVWDPTLAFVMGGGLVISLMSYQFVGTFAIFSFPPKCQGPICQPPGSNSAAAHFQGIPTNQALDLQLIVGAALFGVGWGLAGICPGPAVFQAAVGLPAVLQAWWPAYVIGSLAANYLKQRLAAKDDRSELESLSIVPPKSETNTQEMTNEMSISMGSVDAV